MVLVAINSNCVCSGGGDGGGGSSSTRRRKGRLKSKSRINGTLFIRICRLSISGKAMQEHIFMRHV
jgi:hypothetical protein